MGAASERRVPRRQIQPEPQRLRQRIRQIGRQALQRVVHETPLHLRRDAAGSSRRPARCGRCESSRASSSSRISYCGLVSCRPPWPRISTGPNSTTCCPRAKTSRRNGWFSQVARSAPLASLDERLEDLEAGPPRRAQPAAQDASGDRRGLSRLERGDRLQAAAVFVAERKAVQQIFDGMQARARQIGRAPRADALQVLQRRGEEVVGQTES